ncbi:hypothetical protein ACTA71_004778 [Dictyostelium dimigraforme]
MPNDPYEHPFFDCYKTTEFIRIHKLKRFLYDTTGGNKNWSYKRFDNFQEKEEISTLDYDNILNKWHKSEGLEFIKIKEFKLDNSKQPHLINNPNTINKNKKENNQRLLYIKINTSQ